MYFITASKLHFKLKLAVFWIFPHNYYPPLRQANVVLQP